MSVLGTGCRLALAVIATLLWTDNPAQAERGASRTYWLNIPSQPLERVPECEVRVWDDNLRQQYGSQLAVGANIVLSDLDQTVRLLLDCVERRAVGQATAPTMLVVTPEEWADTPPAMQRSRIGASFPQRRPLALDSCIE